MSEYYNPSLWISYDDAQFIRVCEKCGRFVKPDESIIVNEITGLSKEPNATCKKCDRTTMLFQGFI